MQKIREIIQLLKLFLIAGIDYFNKPKKEIGLNVEMKTSGRQTDCPVIPVSFLGTDAGIYNYHLSQLFYWYTGKLGSCKEFANGVSKGGAVSVFLTLLDQSQPFNDIKDIREKGGGVLLLMRNSSNRKPYTTIYGVYLDEESITPDILISVSPVSTSEEVVTMVYSTDRLDYMKLNVFPDVHSAKSAELPSVEPLKKVAEKETDENVITL